MILQDGNNCHIQHLGGLSLILENRPELKEQQHFIDRPVLNESLTNIDALHQTLQLPYINLTGEDNLVHLRSLASILKDEFQLVYAQVPYRKNSFYYNGEWVTEKDSFYRTKLIHYIYNRVRVVHPLLSSTGVFLLQVDEFLLGECKLLLNEIFGSSQCITTHILEINPAGKNVKEVSLKHTYLLAYAKDIEAYTKYISNVGTADDEGADSSIFQHPTVNNPNFTSVIQDFTSLQKSEATSLEYKLYPLVSNWRKKSGSSSFYPIYYLQKNNNLKNGIDDTPRLSLEPFGNPEMEVIILPIKSDNEEYLWHYSKTTFMKLLREGNIVVKQINGAFKTYYKKPITLNSPTAISSILTGANLASFTREQKKWLEDPKMHYYGLPKETLHQLIEHYSKEGDKILTYDDSSWAFYTACLQLNSPRVLFSSIVDSNYKDHLESINEYTSHPYLTFTFKEEECTSLFDFIYQTKSNLKDFLYLKQGPLKILDDTPSYSILKTYTDEILVAFKIRYDLETYLAVNDKIRIYNSTAKANIYFIDDSSYCQGEHLISHANFSNLLKDYYDQYSSLYTQTI